MYINTYLLSYYPILTLVYLCYDDGCHLKKYAANPKRATQTPTAQKLATMKIVIDKMHFRGHTDTWCQEHCNPYKFDDLNNVS